MSRIGPTLSVFWFLLAAFPGASVSGSPPDDQAQPAAGWAQLTESQLATFRDLPAEEQKNRTRRAEQLSQDLEQHETAPERLRRLREATSLNPVEPELWLKLAEHCRWMGYRHASREALASARSLFKAVRGRHRKDCIRDYSLILGWLEYEAGRWAEAEAWGAKAKEAGAGQQGILLEILGMSARPMTFDEFDLKNAVFLPFENDSHNRRSNAGWAIRLYYHLHNIPFDEYLFKNCQGRKTRRDLNNIIRWRDYGLMCEASDQDEWAACYYRKSREVVKGSTGGWLLAHAGGIPGYLPRQEPQPFWTNQDGYYVTGSLSAYAEYAYAMMHDSDQAARRTFWAEQLLFTATACIHRYPRWPWVYLWRGAAYQALDRNSDALGEVLTSREQFEFAHRSADPRLDPLEGHIRLLQKQYTRAKPLLEKGLQAFPKDAQCWSDLGIIRAAEGDLPGARHAFDRALSLDRRLAVAWHNRGFLNIKEGDWDRALVDLQTAVDLAPHDEQLSRDLQRVRDKVRRDHSATK